ncbi:MAG: amidohydrolase family protein [Bryobacterales bacterium]|nr:amidohydrolase family protein [Bryobacterales bacterium]
MMRAILALAFGVALAGQSPFDVVIRGGRVMDPESGLDAVRDVGIRGGKIAAISTARLAGKVLLAAEGRVVAPGFIDLHAHGQSAESNEFQAHDGVTTALELEVGVPEVGRFLRARSGKALVNFGATASHGAMRTMSMREFAGQREKWRKSDDFSFEVLNRGRYSQLREAEEYTLLGATLERGLREGAMGLGLAPQYYPGATREEIFRVYQMAKRWRAPVFTHVRSMTPDAMQEAIANAAATGAALHIVHVNSMSLGALPFVLDMIEAARKQGMDITTEAYPYTAASTFIESAMFDDGWQERLGISYEDLQWPPTGERMTAETFAKYRKQGGFVIMHMMKPEWIRRAMASPFVMIASDGMPYSARAHPRSAGTFSRVLGLYVREEKILSLMDALGKMTILPARRLESIAPGMKNKGRIRVGADADITVFNPATVRDQATFEHGLRFSSGITHVLVNGVPVVREEKTVPGVFPGQPVTGNFANVR